MLQLFHEGALDMRLVIANEARSDWKNVYILYICILINSCLIVWEEFSEAKDSIMRKSIF